MHERGFTLIEMMATIAIIGILTSVVIISFGPIRERASLRDAESTMQNARAASALCAFRNSNLNAPTPLAHPTNAVCLGSDIVWPNIGQFAPGWSYDLTGFDGDVSDRMFTFSAKRSSSIITCNQDGCTTT